MRRFLQICGLLFLASLQANAQNILFQSGFETGDFTEWAGCWHAANCSVVTDAAAVHSGVYGAQLQYRKCGNPITDPSTLVGEASGGSLGARTYYAKYTYANATGETGSAGNDADWMHVWGATKAVSANYLFTFASPPASYQMLTYNVYLGTSTGTEKLQTLTPVNIGTAWTEPSSCPGGHTCIGGTNLVNDTAVAPGRDTNTAGCGDSHADSNEYMHTDTPSLFPGGEYPEGIRHFWIRGYVKIVQPNTSGGLYQQRKLFYLMGKNYSAECGGNQNCWSYVLGGSPESKNALLSSATSYAGTRCDGQVYGPGTTLGPWQSAGMYYIPTSTFSYTFDTWYCFEVEVKANDPPGSSCTGAIRVWVSGGGYDTTLIDDRSPANISGNRVEGIDRFLVGEQVDRFYYKPVNEDRYWDDVVIADAYIGPGIGQTVGLSTSDLTFDPRTVGTTSAAQRITLSNIGDATLHITSIVASTISAPGPTSLGDFAISATTCGATLAAAVSCTVDVTFTPRAGGNRTGRVRFTTDAASSPDDVSLSGVGLTTAVLKSFAGHFSKT